MKAPFYYQLKVNFLAYNNQDDIKQYNVKKDFTNQNPILARREVFKEFEEYRSWLKLNNRIKNIEDGGEIIIQPKYITEKLREAAKTLTNEKEAENLTIEQLLPYWEIVDDRIIKFREVIEVKIILSDEALEIIGAGIDHSYLAENYDETAIKKMNKDSIEREREQVVHLVSTYVYDPDDQLCGGLSTEFKLFKHYNYDTQNTAIKVEYYGTDYYEAGDDPKAGNYEILETPRKWISEKPEEIDLTENILTINYFIELGECKIVEFKECLFQDKRTKYRTAKTIAAFLNTLGGLIFIGLDNDGIPRGLEVDFANLTGNKKDKFLLKYDDFIWQFFPPHVEEYISTGFTTYKGVNIFIIKVNKCTQPVFLEKTSGGIIQKEFFVRRRVSSVQIRDIEKLINWVFHHWVK